MKKDTDHALQLKVQELKTDLDKKNRELEIETSLERVRTVAMGMNQPDDMIDVCRVISKQLKELNVENIRNVQTAIINDKKETYLNYEYFTQYDTTSILEIQSDLHPRVLEFVKSIKKSKDAFFTTSFTGKDLEEWIEYRQKTNQNPDPLLDRATSIHYYFYSIGPGALGLSTYAPLVPEQLDIFKKFHNVFSLAYKRFMDIQKAEAQAREAQIEAALERVRARMMAMQKSEDLPMVIDGLYIEIRNLGFSETTSDLELTIVNEDDNTMIVWSSTDNFSGPESLKSEMDLDKIPVLDRQFDKWRKLSPNLRKGLDLAFKSEGNEWWAMLDSLQSHPDWKSAVKVFYENNISEWHWHHAYNRYGSIILNGAQTIPRSTLPLLRRFSEIFEQTYTRFLDLQKAEAQAREAQIEAALERMRAQMLAMHNSSDMEKACIVMYEQLNALGIVPESAAVYIAIIDHKTDTAVQWLVSDKTLIQPFDEERTPLTEHKLLIETYKGWKQKDPVLIRDLSGKKLREFTDYLQSLPWQQGSKFESKKLPDRMIWTEATFSHGTVGFIHKSPLPEADIKILIRFSRVFDLTYQRFLDLQKAEAQAREAQIEAALERVRSASMAMHQSDELQQVVGEVFNQLNALYLKMDAVQIEEILVDPQGMHVWVANEHIPYGKRFRILHLGYKLLREYIQARDSGKEEFYGSMSKKSKDNYYKKAFEKTELRDLPDARKRQMFAGDGIGIYASIKKHTSIQLLNFDRNVYTPPERKVVQRFAAVFEQSYTRFLDLQKAEAQAREAQIETALERVRSRSLAMHQSKELVEVATVLHKELRNLNVSEFSDVSIVIVDERNNEQIVWGARTNPDFLEMAILPLLGDQILQKIYDAWHQQEAFFTIKVEGLELLNHNNFVFPKASRTELEDNAIKGMPDPTFFHCASFAMGYLELVADQELSQDSSFVLTRFAKVFEQTYTRFLDLQKAEAQAREAQIETALERVRSRTMAMQKSEELSEAATVLFQQLRELGGNLWSAGFVLLDKRNEEGEFRMSNPEGEIQLPIYIPNTIDPPTKNMYNHWENGDEYYSEEAGGKELKNHYDYLVSLQKAKSTFQALFDAGIKLPTWQQWHVAYFSAGYLLIITLEPYKEADLLKRFAKVFEQVYTRFLDLKKAEAQAREAQIEAALERVRARTMGMHNSDELSETAQLLFNEVQLLGIKTLNCGFNIFETNKPISNAWVSLAGEIRPVFKIPHSEDPSLQRMYQAWKSGESFYQEEIDGKELQQHSNYMFSIVSQSENKKLLNKQGIELSQLPTYQVFNCAFFKQGYMIIITPELNSKDKELFKRFASVFEQTYIRFLDLQKAEAQAREAQIEAALERVRARTMAMHISEELADVIDVVFNELRNLGFQSKASDLCIIDKKTNQSHLWISGELDHETIYVKLGKSKHSHHVNSINAWKKGKQIQRKELKGKVCHDYMQSMIDNVIAGQFPDHVKKFLVTIERVIHTDAYNKYGFFRVAGLDFLSKHEEDILIRFSKVFEQTYTRFIDLTKAEAQAREAQMETSLERVRARAMGLHKSDELKEVIAILYNQLSQLGLELYDANIVIQDESTKSLTFWGSGLGGVEMPPKITIPYLNRAILNKLYYDYDRLTKFRAFEVKGRELKSYHKIIMTETEFKDAPKAYQEEMLSVNRIVLSYISIQHGWLEVASDEFLSKDQEDILLRFGSVVDLTYTRFDDLQKAEAQAREAQIEAALERVRSKTMAMHDSQDVGATIVTLFDEVSMLGLDNDIRCGIGIFEGSERMETWSATSSPDGDVDLKMGMLDMTIHPLLKRVKKAWSSKGTHYAEQIAGNTIIEYYSALNNEPDYSFHIDLDSLPPKEYHNSFSFAEGILFSFSPNPMSDEAIKVLGRFARVFGQTYRRYVDLLKAEAQAREAQIEAALERIRSAAMAMHSSDGLSQVAQVLREQMSLLGQKDLESCIVQLYEKGSDHYTAYYSFKMPNDPKEQVVHDVAIVPWKETAWSQEVIKKYASGNNHFIIHADREMLKEWYQMLARVSPRTVTYDSKDQLVVPEELYYNFSGFSGGFLSVISYDTPSNETRQLLNRGAKTFDMAYRRYVDLQKAEAQAREAQIETALERVRSRTMAMHKSDELAETAAVLFQQFNALGVNPERMNIGIVKEDEGVVEYWSTEQGGKKIDKLFKSTLEEPTTVSKMHAAWKAGKKSLVVDLTGNELAAWLNHLKNEIGLPFKDELLNKRRVHSASFFSHGMILMSTPEPIANETLDLMPRFAKVFEQTYTRFLDLQKAEAQAREAQIEVALERIRSRTMGMQKSDELIAVAMMLNDELRNLGYPKLFEVGYIEWDEKDGYQKGWLSDFEGRGMEPFKLPLKGDWVLDERYNGWKNQESLLYQKIGGKKLIDHVSFCLPTVGPGKVKQQVEENFSDPTHFYHSFFKEGALCVITQVPLEGNQKILLQRFTKVFEQTYTRFLDLKKAEAQSREAQIEAALERIRSKALAMQSSADLHDVSIVLREQMGLLGQQDLESSIVHLYNNSNTLESWYTFRSTETNSKKVVTDVAFIPVDSCDYIKETLEKYNSKETEYTIISKGKKLRDWYNVMVKVAPDTIEYDVEGKMLIPKILYYHHSKFLGGALLMISNQPPSEESKELQQRAAKGFNFAYQRFLDLKKAEAQAREAQIEASLERIRAQAMAMQHSNDLIKSTTILFEELEKLELSVERSGIGIFDDETRDCHLWTTVVTKNGDTELATGITSLTVHPMLIQTFDAWKSQESLLYVLQGKELEDYYRLVSDSEFHLPDEAIENSAALTKEYYLYTPFGAGGLYVFSDTEPSGEEQHIIRRFAEVFHLTYTRYEDLQKAEERAFEAVKQASLDRVRAEIASMRTPEDLNRITPLVWKELTTLSVPFIRCGVLIMDEKRKVIQSYLSAPDGHSLGVFDLPFDSRGIATGALEHWKEGTIYKDHWNKDQFLKFSKNLVKLGQIQDIKTYQGASTPPESLDLHFMPFKQGMLYVGNTKPLKEDKIILVQALANAFSIAYARYEDFIQLEQAKNQIEQALGDLKSTQTQLVHAEKMASLGELTAGIAHEIQNPLNFVNNFSEVSVDLIEELKEEKEKGLEERDGELEDEILDDVIQNLEKIHHHGQRASGIVKGMLEHSRTGIREKELTDINMLADEYLRLAYHGLRAKDKTFNAEFNTELDDQLPKVKIISQDIGRVLLNLINNAFYAVSNKSRQVTEGLSAGTIAKTAYKPVVSITTKRNDKTVEISVEDNGGGIPNDVVDKIFQPFFTTKPTGEGTGLGLSLSYDIVTQGHDGHLEVETEEGVGTRFIIILPD